MKGLLQSRNLLLCSRLFEYKKSIKDMIDFKLTSGIEPPTSSLPMKCSTPEPRQQL